MITEADFDQWINEILLGITLEQSQDLTTAIVAFYKAGSHSINSKRLSKQQLAAIDKLSAEHFGKISEFNNAIGEQIKNKARLVLSSGGGYEEIEKEIFPYVSDVFKGNETILFDNRGKLRTEIKVDKYGRLYEKEVEITRVYKTNVRAYTEMLSRTATHTAWEHGRLDEYARMGFDLWRFTGVIDERCRATHAACVGQIYEYGTNQSDLAMKLLAEPHCRHRVVPIYNDPVLDTPQEFYEGIKVNSGLTWDSQQDDWVFAATA